MSYQRHEAHIMHGIATGRDFMVLTRTSSCELHVHPATSKIGVECHARGRSAFRRLRRRWRLRPQGYWPTISQTHHRVPPHSNWDQVSRLARHPSRPISELLSSPHLSAIRVGSGRRSAVSTNSRTLDSGSHCLSQGKPLLGPRQRRARRPNSGCFRSHPIGLAGHAWPPRW